ncbi:MAG: VanZ family protein [Candidatus Kerfeldbacteria bacterium]|nr:VanZ family protein [Candidatus Kerfeldbacteria bacterium]
MRSSVVRWLLVVFWAGLIFFLSSIPSLESGFSLTWDVIARKAAHALEYAVLAALLVRAFRRVTVASILVSGILAIVYAMSDEIHQLFVDGRSGTALDVFLDAIGAMCGLLVVWRWGRGRPNNKKP